MELIDLVFFSAVDYIEYLIILSGLFNRNIIKGINIKGLLTVLSFILISGLISNYLGQEKAFVVNSIMIIFMIFFIYRAGFAVCIYSYMISTAVLLSVQMISFVLLQFLKGDMSLSSESGLLVHLPTLLIVLLIRRFVPLKKLMIMKLFSSKTFRFILSNTFFILMGCLVFLLTRSEDFLVNALYFMVIVLMVFIINILLFTSGLRNEKDREQLQLYERYLPVIEELMNDIRSKQHDYDNHIQSINSILNTKFNKNDDFLEIKNYVEDVRFDKKIANLGKMKNSILAGLIYTKSKSFEKKRIDFKIDIRDYLFETSFRDYEVVEMTGILLDNAIEATQENELVIMNIYNEDDFKVIEVLNQHEYIGANTIDKMFRQGYTNKSENGHGYGLDNLVQIMKRNKGEYVVSNKTINGFNFLSIKLLLL